MRDFDKNPLDRVLLLLIGICKLGPDWKLRSFAFDMIGQGRLPRLTHELRELRLLEKKSRSPHWYPRLTNRGIQLAIEKALDVQASLYFSALYEERNQR